MRQAAAARWLLLAALGACEAEPSVPRLRGPCERARITALRPSSMITEVDLLLVLDDSPGGGEVGDRFPDALLALVHALVTGDDDADGVADARATFSLQVGVVTTDLGAGPLDTPDCAPGSGRDAVLLTRSAGPGCAVARGSGIFELRGSASPAEASELACVAQTSTAGCAYPQPLEAALLALSPALATTYTRPGYVPPRFADATGTPEARPGHGCGPGEACANAGFLRPGSVLAVVLVTGRDDCSSADARVMDASDTRYGDGAPLVRCATASRAGALRPIERFVDGLLGLRRDPARMVFAVIAGTPPDLDGASAGEMLIDSRLSPVIAPAGDAVAPSCTTPDGVDVTPPRRILEVAEGLRSSGVTTVVRSVCGPSLDPAIDAIVGAVREAQGGVCLPRSLSGTWTGERMWDCTLYELLATGSAVRCADLPGRLHAEWVHEPTGDRERCLLARAATVDQPGWLPIVDPDDSFECEVPPEPGVALAGGITLAAGSEVQSECAVLPAGSTLDVRCDADAVAARHCSIGTWCVPGDPDPCTLGAPTDTRLVCDAIDRVCALPCAHHADCATATSEPLCDLRTYAEAAGPELELREPLASRIRGTCVPSTCRAEPEP